VTARLQASQNNEEVPRKRESAATIILTDVRLYVDIVESRDTIVEAAETLSGHRQDCGI
jgi:hypothetical protein